MSVNDIDPTAQHDRPPERLRSLTRPRPRFQSVGAIAKAFGMSEATLYRAIRCGEFPAVRIRNRYVIPTKVIDALEDAAMASGGTVDAAAWVDAAGREVE